jgi:hypothetical protein
MKLLAFFWLAYFCIHSALASLRVKRWFALRFPEGTIVRGKTTGDLYLLRNGERRPIKNLAIAASLIDTSKIVMTDDSHLSSYRPGPPVNFPNFSLVQTAEGLRYLLAGNAKRLIQPSAFEKFGFNEDELIEIVKSDLEGYTDGPDITTSTTYPTGLLVKDPDKAYWYIENGMRQRIPDSSFLTLYFRGRRAKAWTAKQLGAMSPGPNYGLQDGELVRGKTSPAVYVIEAGHRRPITSETDFTELGYAWKNVVMLPDRLLETYPIGALIQPHAAPDLSELVIAPASRSTSTALLSSL